MRRHNLAGWPREGWGQRGQREPVSARIRTRRSLRHSESSCLASESFSDSLKLVGYPGFGVIVSQGTWRGARRARLQTPARPSRRQAAAGPVSLLTAACARNRVLRISPAQTESAPVAPQPFVCVAQRLAEDGMTPPPPRVALGGSAAAQRLALRVPRPLGAARGRERGGCLLQPWNSIKIPAALPPLCGSPTIAVSACKEGRASALSLSQGGVRAGSDRCCVLDRQP